MLKLLFCSGGDKRDFQRVVQDQRVVWMREYVFDFEGEGFLSHFRDFCRFALDLNDHGFPGWNGYGGILWHEVVLSLDAVSDVDHHQISVIDDDPNDIAHVTTPIQLDRRHVSPSILWPSHP